MTEPKKQSRVRTNKSSKPKIMIFKTAGQMENWLDKNHESSTGIWLRLKKKGSDIQSVTYDEALDVALCYGWIDGQKKSNDGSSWLQKKLRRGAQKLVGQNGIPNMSSASQWKVECNQAGLLLSR